MNKANVFTHPAFNRPAVENEKRRGRPAGAASLAAARRRKTMLDRNNEWHSLAAWAKRAGHNHLLPLEKLREMKTTEDLEAQARLKSRAEMEQIDILMARSHEIFEQALRIREAVLSRYVRPSSR